MMSTQSLDGPCLIPKPIDAYYYIWNYFLKWKIEIFTRVENFQIPSVIPKLLFMLPGDTTIPKMIRIQLSKNGIFYLKIPPHARVAMLVSTLFGMAMCSLLCHCSAKPLIILYTLYPYSVNYFLWKFLLLLVLLQFLLLIISVTDCLFLDILKMEIVFPMNIS